MEAFCNKKTPKEHKNRTKNTNLHAVNGQAWPSVQLFMTNVAFEMLGLLVLDEDLFVIEVSITIPSGNG